MQGARELSVSNTVAVMTGMSECARGESTRRVRSRCRAGSLPAGPARGGGTVAPRARPAPILTLRQPIFANPNVRNYGQLPPVVLGGIRHVQDECRGRRGGGRAGRRRGAARAGEQVRFDAGIQPGTIVIRTGERRLYFTLGGGNAIRYPVAVGKPGKLWYGWAAVDGKYVAPAWSPPAEVSATTRACRASSPAARPRTRWVRAR